MEDIKGKVQCFLIGEKLRELRARQRYYEIRAFIEEEKRYNPYHDPKNGQFASGKSGLTNSSQSDTIGTRGESVSISSIDSPIEQSHTGKGNPNAILHKGVELNNRQKALLEKLPDYDSRTTVGRDDVNMSDLSALTAYTGDEYAMFTNKNERLIIRGNAVKVNISPEDASELNSQGYKWSGHTHPGVSDNVLMPSLGDVLVLREFDQETSVIYNSKGNYFVFGKE